VCKVLHYGKGQGELKERDPSRKHITFVSPVTRWEVPGGSTGNGITHSQGGHHGRLKKA